MRPSLLLLLSALLLLFGISAAVAPSASPETGDAEETRHDPAELEKAFRETMNGAMLEGKWRLVKDGELGEERTERYSLGEVKKIEGDRWLIEARVQFGEKDVRLPVPVRVLWAGDTPVITVTDLWLPGLGKYTARVLVYNGLYTGTWFGAGYGGLMSGRVVSSEGARRSGEDPDAGSETAPETDEDEGGSTRSDR